MSISSWSRGCSLACSIPSNRQCQFHFSFIRTNSIGGIILQQINFRQIIPSIILLNFQYFIGHSVNILDFQNFFGRSSWIICISNFWCFLWKVVSGVISIADTAVYNGGSGQPCPIIGAKVCAEEHFIGGKVACATTDALGLLFIFVWDREASDGWREESLDVN